MNPQPQNKIGPIKATSLVAGNMIGSGVLMAPAILAPFGAFSFVGWILTTIGAVALALVFSRLSIWIPKSGGPYTFVRHVFGDFVGFQMAWGYWVSTWCGSASLLVATLQYMSIFCPNLIANQQFCIIFGVALVIFFTIINLFGVKESTEAEVVIVAIKIFPLVLIAAVGIFFVDFSILSFVPTEVQKDPIGSLGAMSGTLLWAFIGLESATVPSGFVKNPKKTIPLATIAGVLITAAVYIGGAVVISGVIPFDELIAAKAPYVDAAQKLFGDWGAIFMIVTGIIGIAGSLNGWILIQGQVACSAAQEGLFPKYFEKTNKYGIPHGVPIGSALMIIVFLLTYQPGFVEYVKLLIDMAVLAMLLPYFYSTIAFCYLAVTKKSELSRGEKISLSIVGLVSVIYSFCAIFGAGKDLIYLCFLVFLASVPFYCMLRQKNA